MTKFKLTQPEVDSIVMVERVDARATVFGCGFNDVNIRIKVDGGVIWQYLVWRAMLGRCYSDLYKAKQPTYQDVTCCDEWFSFGSFLEWVNREVGYSGKPEGMELDKDLIIRGNKAYSPETCSFVPKSINLLLGNNKAVRGDWPVGVRLHKRSGKFDARMSCGNEKRYLGQFDNPQDAFMAYKVAKEAQIKLVAMQYKDVLKPAVFESLMNWEILSDD